MDALAAEGRIRLSNADYLARPLRFTLDEAMSLAVALRALLELGDSAHGRGGVVRAGEDRGGRRGIRAARRRPVGGGEDAVRDALAARPRGAASRSRWTYDGASRGVTTTPLVDPLSGRGARRVRLPGRLELRAGRLAHLPPRPDRGRRRRPISRSPTTGRRRASRAAGSTIVRTPSRSPRPRAAGSLDHRVLPDAVGGAPGGRRRPGTLLVADPAWLRRLLLRLGPCRPGGRPARGRGVRAGGGIGGSRRYRRRGRTVEGPRRGVPLPFATRPGQRIDCATSAREGETKNEPADVGPPGGANGSSSRSWR